MMRQVLWVVQTNLGNSAAHEAIETACHRHNALLQGVEIIPFSDELPLVEYDGPILAYGATRFINAVAKSKQWWPGAFFDETTFTFVNCLKAWQRWMFNGDATICRLDEVSALPFADTERLFVRPDLDLKEFSGQVTGFAELRDWAALIAAGDFELKPDMKIIIARPKPIDREWRVFVVDGCVVAASRYRLNGHLAVEQGAPPEVIAFVEARLQEWLPSPAFALDIAEHEGELAIMELSDIHSAGHYAADLDAIVAAMTRLAEKMDRETLSRGP